jgi:hypothetical protein
VYLQVPNFKRDIISVRSGTPSKLLFATLTHEGDLNPALVADSTAAGQVLHFVPFSPAYTYFVVDGNGRTITFCSHNYVHEDICPPNLSTYVPL